MVTIVEPKEAVDKLWGKQRIREGETYRLMRYLLRVDHDGKVLLHNVVTGRLVVLDEAEAEALERMPMAYSPEIEQLVTEHYLVPEDYDEHQRVMGMRNVLWKMVDAHSSKDITYYTILPTTTCNARCWYCFQNGVKPTTMTEETANDVVAFIARSCGGKPIQIRWFGGEPTIVSERIDQISEGLQNCGVVYNSIITTNGYNFDEGMVIRAKNVWNTTQVGISIDGTEESYNRVKAFQGVKDNPYQRMMENVDLLLKAKISVIVRMNYDESTWQDFPKLLKEMQERFHNNQQLMVYPHQINVDVSEHEWIAREAWLNQKNNELRNMAIASGYYRKKGTLPDLNYLMCEAGSNECVTIMPDGSLVSCAEQLSEDQVKGNVLQGVTNRALVSSWKRFADYKRCHDCVLFPCCARMAHCAAVDHCSGKTMLINQITGLMVDAYVKVMR